MREMFNLFCKECQTSRIVYDESKGELFCRDCGMVFEENYKIFSISDYEEMMKEFEAEERKLLMKEC